MKQVETLVNHYYDKVVEYRRWIHAHPEVSGQEKETAAYIAKTLRKIGLEPTENVGGYGVTAVIEGAKPGKCVGLRADFDALPIQECTGLPFASINPGVSHCCGHDAHTAMLLGAAHILNDLRDQFAGCVKLIFQPSEENAMSSGAKKMIADGVLENPHVDAVIGQHVDSSRETGCIALRYGSVSAASDRFFITVKGKACHASRPHTGIDAAMVGAYVLTALQSIVARNVNPLESSVITVGKVKAGSQYNVVAETCEMEGTCRNQSPAIRDAMPQRMENIIKGVAEGMGADYTFEYIKGYSPVVNEKGMTDLLIETASDLLGREHVQMMEHATMGGEDFSFYAEKVPGVFYRLGCHREGTERWPGHNGHFSPDEEAMKIGARVMITSALNFLNGEKN